MNQLFIKLVLTVCLIFVLACQKGSKPDTTVTPVDTSKQSGGKIAVIRYQYKPGEIRKICKSEMKRTDDRIAEVLKIPAAEKNFENTILAFEEITSDLSENTNQPTFMNSVSMDKDIRKESEECETELGQYSVGLGTRRDIYDAIVLAQKQTPSKKMDAGQKRLVEETLKVFRQNGLYLPDDKLKKVKELKQKLSTLETQFGVNLNENTDYEEMTAADLEGVPETIVSRFQKLPNGNYKVTTKPTDYTQFMENAKSSAARRRMAVKYENRAAEANSKLLKEAIGVRKEIATLLGFKTWADYKIQDRMAKNSKTALDFLNGLKSKIALRNKKDLAALLKMKKEIYPGSTKLDAWDGGYLAYQLKKKEYSLDNEAIREYFPADHVVSRMFEIYSTLFGVKFIEVKDADVWAPHVKLYEIRDKKTNDFIANFFTDFVPREGKYGHAAAFTLRSGRMVDGKYRTPISSIVSNFNPPADGKPSLLNHDEVETLFHEFGHIMHQTLTKAPYASLSGSSVARDFVEAPSQMLENWVWDAKLIKDLSHHYKTGASLPDNMIKKLIAARDFNRGYFYTRQLLFGLFDLTLHTSDGKIDPTETYKKLYKEMTSIDPIPETHWPASFGHLMGGYDSGYYGYLWSEVFAQDMFTKFEEAGLLSSKVGAKYRKEILEAGDMREADKLLVSFLGRKPNNKAFFKQLGIK